VGGCVYLCFFLTLGQTADSAAKANIYKNKLKTFISQNEKFTDDHKHQNEDKGVSFPRE